MKDEHLTPHDEALTRWIDGALDPAGRDAFEQRLTDPAAKADAERAMLAASSLGALLREHAPTEREPAYPDFFNSHLLRQIREEKADDARAAAAAPRRAGWFDWLRSPWLSLAGAAAVIVVAGVMLTRPAEAGTRVISVFSPEPNATAHTFVESGAVVIDVEGLETYPDERAVLATAAGAEDEAFIAHSL